MKKSLIMIIVVFVVVAMIGIGVVAYKIGENKGKENSNTDNPSINANNNEAINLNVEAIYNKAKNQFPLYEVNLASGGGKTIYEATLTVDNRECYRVVGYKGHEGIFSTNANIVDKRDNTIINNIIFRQDGIMYIDVRADSGYDIGGVENFNSYVSAEFTKTSESNDRIEYSVRVKYGDTNHPNGRHDVSSFDYINNKYIGNNFLYREDKFVLVKEKGEWLVEYFVIPYFGVGI